MSNDPSSTLPRRQVVVITGASDGIGAELARQWAQRKGPSVRLVLAARRTEALQAVAAQCASHGAEVQVESCDVRDPAQCQALVRAAVAQGGRIDTLVLNAGMSAHAELAEVQDMAWYEDLMKVNFWGAAWCAHAALEHLIATRGQIVAVSSLAGLVGVPGRTAYSATKFAMTGFFEALRTEVHDHGVAVTIAYPGVVATEIRRLGYAADGKPAGRSGLDERGAMTVATCAELILNAALQRRREVVMSAKGKLGRWLKLIAPEWVDRMARRALNREGAH